MTEEDKTSSNQEESEKEELPTTKGVDLSLGLSEVEDEEAAIDFRNQNRKKSTVDLGLGLYRLDSMEDGEVTRKPGNPILKVGLERASSNEEEEKTDSKEENLLPMSDMMSLLHNDSLGGEAWENKVDTREDEAKAECENIMEQLGLSSSDLNEENTEIWEKKATSKKTEDVENDPIATETVFNMLGLSDSDVKASEEAWESKTAL